MVPLDAIIGSRFFFDEVEVSLCLATEALKPWLFFIFEV
jgi:hypothetical protein